jgi:hypothetical protein
MEDILIMATINLARKSGVEVALPMEPPEYPCVHIGGVGELPKAEVGDMVILHGKIKSVTKTDGKEGDHGHMEVEVHEMDHKGGKESSGSEKSNHGNNLGSKRKDELAIDHGLKQSEKHVSTGNNGNSKPVGKAQGTPSKGKK